MDRLLTKACTVAITKYIDDIFDSAPNVADAIAQLPFNQEPCFAGWRDCAALRFTLFFALCHREAFRQKRPLEVLERKLELPLAPLAARVRYRPDKRKYPATPNLAGSILVG
jgi:hypothetical protein